MSDVLTVVDEESAEVAPGWPAVPRRGSVVDKMLRRAASEASDVHVVARRGPAREVAPDELGAAE